MAELSTDISAKLGARNRQTQMIERHKLGGMVERMAKPVWTIISATDAVNDIIPLDRLSPGEIPVFDLCNVVCPNPGTALVIDIGFRALNGAASVKDINGNTVTNDPDAFADGIVLSNGGKIEWTSIPVAYHTAPVQFAETVEIIATLKTVTSLTNDTKVQFNNYYVY